MTGKRRTTTRILSVVCAGAMLLGVINIDNFTGGASVSAATVDTSTVHEVTQSIDTKTEELFDPSVVYQLTDTVTADTEISVIVTMSEDTVYDAYEESGSGLAYGEYAATSAGVKAAHSVSRASNKLIKKLNRSGVKYTLGETYDTLLSGFEITIKAGDYTKVAKAVPEATLIVGEEYERCETEVVTNEVDVYDTGIFDSSKSQYQGDGVVVAVLDTGLDYTHSAFSEMPEETPIVKSDVEALVSSGTLNASTRTAGLTADDVYYNAKVPYMYDYADNDPDVFPINSEHGTHVSGIITGKNNVITGVAPGAQLVPMKVFSDSADGAKTSWILAALEDCVTIGVDVINMSLGTSCGFSREADKDNVNAIYDRIEEAGISLVCAASNDYNATMGSDKNGSLGLTSNPDSGTVGSPSTYDAALSVGSVSGVMTNYIKYGDEIIYFNEATDSTATTRNFVDDLMKRMGKDDSDYGTYEVPYVVIPGLGRSSDYTAADPDYYKDKIVLVRRGTTTFEEKIRVAMSKGALGIIIYNNVSGTISMSIGQNEDAAACSISQDDGEKLVATGSGTITVSRSQQAGPFMSDFSSWGPTSDLKIKPEITAHGGDIYSCVPGEGYDRLSGTSMAAPNQTGVTALIRQYVKDNPTKFGLGEPGTTEYNLAVTAAVNQLMMSTADIIYNKNALPYAVRKQGAGLVNLYDAQDTDGYIVTYDRDNGTEMSKAKIELGDDKEKTGVYEATFTVKNISSVRTTYKVDALIQTEGVSTTYTGHGDTTVSQDGYALDGTSISVTGVDGTGSSHDGNEITVAANGSATVTVKIVLSEDDKDYMNESFEHGMYVEGFITLEELGGSGSEVDINVPLLAFYGDWTEAPIFDEEYYDTNVDEVNAGLNDDDKLMADAYATRVVGGLYNDYIAYMGTYYFTQDPSMTQIAASKDHIAMSNQSSSSSYTINNLDYVYAGLLRNVGEIDVVITEDSTGKTIYTDEVYNQRKSYGSSTIYTSAIDMKGFSAAENNLKNNTQYTVTLTAYLDYGEKDDQNNVRNVFSFPLFIDYEAPVVTGAEFRKETDQTTKETKLYVDLEIYDNHYAMAAQLGNVVEYQGDESYLFSIQSFGKYATPVYSSFNSTSKVTFELTDYIDEIKNSQGLLYDTEGNYQVVKNSNTFIVICYDYAMNQSIYEIRIPDEIISMYLITDEDDGTSKITNAGSLTEPDYQVTLALNETLDLSQFLAVYPDSAWVQAFDYEIAKEDEAYVRVVNQTVLALAYTDEPVVLTITANSANEDEPQTLTLKITVSGNKGYTLPVVNSFSITDYYVEKAFYAMSSDDREIGLTGYTYDFGDDTTLSMFPSESVTINYNLQTYFPDDTKVVFSVGNSDIVKIPDENKGTIVAQAEGSTTVTATVYYSSDGGETWRSQRSDRISVTVKDPFTTSSIYLMSYKGLGGTVKIPDDRGITTIYQYAFSNYEYVEKDLNNGDVIDDEDPYSTKPWFIGEDTIDEIIIPEGVKEIQGYAFAGLKSLKKVVFPSTLTRIGYGAFYGCTSLETIQFGEDGKGENNIQFINEAAFYNCTSLETFDFSSVVGIGKYAFYNSALYSVELPRTCQTLAYAAFANCSNLNKLTVNAGSVKLDSYVFAYCTSLTAVTINTSVIPSYAFYGCTKLSSIELGMDVSVINENAFMGSKISSFTVNPFNPYIAASSDNTEIYSKDGATLYAVVPTLTGEVSLDDTVKTISTGAFAGTKVTSVIGSNVTKVLSYAFYNCTSLGSVSFGTLTEIGDYAFYKTNLNELPKMKTGTETDPLVIGEGAFACTSLPYNGDGGVMTISAYTEIGDYAFYESGVVSVKIGDDVTIGYAAFAYCESLTTVEIGDRVEIGDYAFCGYLLPDYGTWYAMYGSDSDTYYYEHYLGKAYVKENSYYANDIDGNKIGGSNVGDQIYLYNKAELYVYDFVGAYTGSLTTVSVGAGCTVGNYAFANNAKLSDLTLGNDDEEKIDIGDYAFYNCVGLTNVGFGNVRSVGAYAFSVTREVADVMMPVSSSGEFLGTLSIAYDMVIIYDDDGGETTMSNGYRYQEYSGGVSGELDLSGVEYIGEYAFAYNNGIGKITFGSGLKKIGAYAFYCCGLIDGSDGELDLTGMDDIGAYAFALTGLTSVTLKENVRIGDGAFCDCSILTVVTGLEYAQSIGAYAFAGTALSSINISSAQYVGDFAFADIASEGVIEVVIFDKDGVSLLGEVGENPFRGTDVIFVGVYEDEDQEPSYGDSFGISEAKYNEDGTLAEGAIFVSDGVLYQQVNNGYVLVSYPLGKTDATYTLEDGTVRISASAFRGNKYIKNVVMSSELVSIGDKAFYGCDSLALVVFTSYYAPALEEEYDETYQLYSNLAMTGNYAGFTGLGIVDYYMWSVGPNNFFYGATFVDYVGKVENKIVMVAPVNGQQYDSFIYAQYFDTVVYGAASASPATLQLISDIDEKLSGTITLEDEALINELLNSYNLLTPEQQALVTNYDKLSSAYQTLRFLQLEAEDSSAGDILTEDEKTDGAFVKFMKDNYIGLIIALIFLILFVVTLAFMIVSERRSSKASDGAAEGEGGPDDASSPDGDEGMKEL